VPTVAIAVGVTTAVPLVTTKSPRTGAVAGALLNVTVTVPLIALTRNNEYP
jgi:hypothetical protein